MTLPQAVEEGVMVNKLNEVGVGCAAWLKKPCCPCDWFTHTHDRGDMWAIEGEAAVCTIACSGDTAHIFHAGERCGRFEVPPLVPSWSHERAYGHEYVAP